MQYSHRLELYAEELPQVIRNSIKEIETFTSQKALVLKYDSEHIAIPLNISINLPSRGAVDGIDIGNVEPMLLKISLKKYPFQIPDLLSDREDFPRTRLAHLYVSKESDPARLCLVRNNPNEWYANHRITDLLIVGQQWLFKAASGLLTNDGDEFDPTRITYSGFHVYQYDLFNRLVKNNERFIPGSASAVLMSAYYQDENRPKMDELLKTVASVPFLFKNKAVEIVRSVHQKNESKNSLPLFSLLVWSDSVTPETEYNVELPKNFKELNSYMTNHGIQIENVLDLFYENGFDLCTYLPITHAIKRPKKIVGYNGVYEFITYTIYIKDFAKGKYTDEAEVKIKSHIEPFSFELAQKLAGESRKLATIYVGAGSLGSKMILHDARSGKFKIGVVDNDELLEHNVARHALFPNKVGWNKSLAIVNEISSLFTTQTSQYKAFDTKVEDLSMQEFAEYDWLVDSTASTLVLNYITKSTLHKKLSIARCELVNEGKLGLLYIEGSERNPRIDDLVNLTYFYANSYPKLKEWRLSDAKREVMNLDVGLGCSSTTTVMSDELVSFHSSVFSKLLHNETEKTQTTRDGVIDMSVINTSDILEIMSEHIIVKPFDILNCQAGSDWEIRLISGLADKLITSCRENGNRETGGILIGLSNYKTKTIHIFDIVTETPDSAGTCSGFTRGTKGLPEYVNNIRHSTGEVIGYIGEWHTHPMNLEKLSERDLSTIEELKKINIKVPIPTCAIIVTSSKILPFIFD